MGKIATIDEFQQATAVLALCVFEPNDEKITAIVNQYRNEPDRELWAEKKDGKTIGIIGIKMHGNDCEIIHLAVIPEYLKMGIAGAMLEEVASRQNMGMLLAETDIEAVDFYWKCGFSITNL